MTIGTYEAMPDTAGRVVIPLPLRRSLADDLVICPSMPPERHLMVFDPRGFEEFLKRLFPYELVRRDSLSLKRRMVGGAHEAKIDKAGRINIPQRLREFARITAGVMVLGMDDHLEIWAAERYEAWDEESLSDEEGARFDERRAEMEAINRERQGLA